MHKRGDANMKKNEGEPIKGPPLKIQNNLNNKNINRRVYF